MEYKYYIYVCIASFIWGTSFPAITIGLHYTSPEMLLFLRFLIATIVGFILYPSSIASLRDKDLIIIGMFNALGYLVQFIGQQYVPAGQASILVNFYAVTVPIISIFILHEIPNKKIFLSVFIGFFGVILLTGYQSIGNVSYDQYIFGAIAIFISGILWAFYVVYTKKAQMQEKNDGTLGLKYTSPDLFNASMFYTTLTAFISLFFVPFSVNEINIQFIIISIYLGIFPTVIAFSLYLLALEKIDATKVSIILLSQVMVAYFLSILFLEEIIGLYQVIGTIFILLSIVLVVKIENKSDLSTN